MMTDYLQAERGCLLITQDGHELLLFHGDEDLNLKFPFSRSVVSEAMRGNTGLVSFQSPDSLNDGPVSSMALHGVRAAVCAPILGPNEEDYGVVYFDTRVEDKLFSYEQLQDVISLSKAMAASF